MPFNPDEYLKNNSIDGIAKGFNPDAYLSKEEGPKNRTSPLEAFVQGAGKELTLGYLPQLQAIGAKAVDKYFNVPNAPEYTQLRDEAIKRDELLKKEHPVATGTGMAAGVLTGAGLLSGAAPAATIAGRIGQAAKTGAVLGGISNPGDVEGKSSFLQLGARAKNAVIGGATGAAFQGALESVSPIASYVSEKLGNTASEKAVKALGGTSTQKQKIQDFGIEQKLGKQLLDDNIIPKFGTPTRILNRIDDAKSKVGKDIGSIVSSAGDAKVIDVKNIAQDLATNSDIAQLRGIPGAESLSNTADQILNTLGSRGSLSLKDTQTLRQQIDKQINFAGNLDKGKQYILKLIRDRLASSMNEAADKYGIGGLKDANIKFSNLSRAEDMVKNKLGREAANRSFGLTDLIAAGAGVSAGGTPGTRALLGAALGGANKFVRTFGSSLSARSTNALSKLSKVISSGASSISKYPKSIALVSNRLTQSSPFQRIEEDPMLNDPKIVDFFRKNPSFINGIQDERLKAGMNKIIKGK